MKKLILLILSILSINIAFVQYSLIKKIEEQLAIPDNAGSWLYRHVTIEGENIVLKSDVDKYGHTGTVKVNFLNVKSIRSKYSRTDHQYWVIFDTGKEHYNPEVCTGDYSSVANKLVPLFTELVDYLLANTPEGKKGTEEKDYNIAQSKNTFDAWYSYAEKHKDKKQEEIKTKLMSMASSVKEYGKISNLYSDLNSQADLKAYELVKTGDLSHSSDYLVWFKNGKYLTSVNQYHTKYQQQAKIARQKEIQSWDMGDKICWSITWTEHKENYFLTIYTGWEDIQHKTRIEGYIENFRSDKSKFQLRVIYSNASYDGRTVNKQDVIWIDPNEGWFKCK